MTSDAKFWDGIAEKYARDPIKDMESYEYTLERTRSYLGKSDKVVELGAGTGSTALLLADAAGHITATDLSEGMLNVGRRNAKAQGIENVDFLCRDAMVQGLEVGSFDVVMAFNLLHLVENLDAVLERSRDLLKPGGLLITKTPCLDDSGFFARVAFRIMIPAMQLFRKAPFVSFMTSQELERRVMQAGFTIIERVNLPAKGGRPYFVARRD